MLTAESTTATSHEPRATKPEAVKTASFIVLRAGRPCRLQNNACTLRGGVLLPGSPVQVFARRRDARRAINRTKRVAKLLKGSLLEPIKPVQELLQALVDEDLFTIEPLSR